MPRAKRPPAMCPECGRMNRHSATCSKGRCVSCRRAPAVIGTLCSFCWSRRKKVVAQRIERLDGP
jgi:hypothetical protein